MRNLKRTLCLVMAAVMMLGLMVIGAGAVSYNDLNDKDQIVHEEAVATMNALGLIEGRDNGSFDPTAFITRAEMCKVITLALHGGTDPVLGTSSSTFWDTAGHWAETYIEYCAANGIIAGRGDGSFDPNSNITGTEAAKMILVALGYKSDVFIFTGPDWAINVDTRANDAYARLYDDLGGLNSGAAINRDNAAQMLYNGVIKAKMLIMKPSQSITSGEVTYEWDWHGSMLNEKFNASIYEGVIVANQYANLDAGLQSAGEYLFSPILKDEVKVGPSTTNRIKVAGDTTLDMLGKTYKVIIQDTVKGGVHTVVYGDLIYSDLNKVYTVSSKKTDDIMSVLTFTNEVRATGINSVGSARVYEDFKVAEALESFGDLQGETDYGKIIEVIDNDNDGNADYILVNTPIIGQITTYNANGNNGAGAITVAAKSGVADSADYITSVQFDGILTYDNLGVDDIVSYILLPSNLYYIVALESVSGSVTAQTNADLIKLDGVEYRQSSLGKYFDEENSDNIRNATTLGKDATLYLDKAGYVAYITASTSGYNYLYMTDVEGLGTVSGVNAKVVFEDGTTSVINIKSITTADGDIYKPGANTSAGEYELTDENYMYGVTPAAFGLTTGGDPSGISKDAGKIYYDDTWSPKLIFKYNLDGGKYELTLASQGSLPAQKVLSGRADIANTGSKLADSRTIFLMWNGSSYNVYTGVGNIKSTDENAEGLYAYNTKNNAVEFVVVTKGITNTTSKSIYILSDEITARTGSNNETIYTVKALVDGEYNGELQLKNATGITDQTKVRAGLYTGEGITLDNGRLEFTWVKEDSPELPKKDVKNQAGEVTGQEYSGFYSDPSYLHVYSNSKLTTQIGDKTGDGATGTLSTVTTNDKTKVIIITGAEENEIFLDGRLSDIAYDKTLSTDVDDYSKNSMVAVVRGGYNADKDSYFQASIIYIIRK